jgi:flagellar FliJ protein
MGFKFSLETVLRHRKRLEDEAQRAFSEARQKLEDAKRHLEFLYSQVDRSREEIASLQNSGEAHSVSSILEREAFIRGQALRIKNHREAMRSLQQDLEEKQEALVLALRERKTLEKLKEKKKREYDMEVARKEALFLDEIATMRAGGRR